MTNFNNYNEVEKYVACTGESADSDRFIEITVNDKEVLLCMDEDHRVMQVITVDEEAISEDNIEDAKECAAQLIEEARIALYTDKQEKYWTFYIEQIQAENECIQADNDMLIVKSIS